MEKINKVWKGGILVIVVATIMLVGAGVVVLGENDEANLNRIYDVNRDGIINFQDAGLCWLYIRDGIDDPYGNLLFDVNIDGIVDENDYKSIWYNRDSDF